VKGFLLSSYAITDKSSIVVIVYNVFELRN